MNLNEAIIKHLEIAIVEPAIIENPNLFDGFSGHITIADPGDWDFAPEEETIQFYMPEPGEPLQVKYSKE